MSLNLDSVKLDSLEAQGGYGIGLQIGQQLISSGLDVEPEAVVKGIFDVLNQNEPALDINTVTKALQELQQRAEAAQLEAFKALEEEGKAFLAENKKHAAVKETASGLQYQVLKQGSGKRPSATSKVTVHYEGRLMDGTVFDSSIDRGEPLAFSLNQVIAGWTEGLQLMQEGSKYRFVIPSNLAYGETGAGESIEPNKKK